MGSDRGTQHGFKLGKNRSRIETAITSTRQGEHMVRRDAVSHDVSTSRRKGVVAVTVLVTDTAIRTMDDEFRLLVPRDIPRCINGLLLRVVHGGCPLVARAFDSPSALMGNNMLIFT